MILETASPIDDRARTPRMSGLGDLKKIGRLGLKTLGYFEVVTTLALVIGLLVAGSMKPGARLNIDPASLDLIPRSFAAALVDGRLLQVLVLAVLYGIGLASIGEHARPGLHVLQAVTRALFAAVNIVVRFAPFGSRLAGIRLVMINPRAWLGLLAVAACATAAEPRPNIVFIVADDLGWSDLACYGSGIHVTPNLDRLAAQGMRFTQAYAAAPICSASRAAMLTGRSPARLHFEFVTKYEPGQQHMNQPLQSPPFTLDLPLGETTLGEALHGAGYVTGFYGKWHVARHEKVYLGWSPTHGPLQQGYLEGNMEFGLHPYGDATRPPAESGDLPPGDYGRDALTARAIDFLGRHRHERFFLQLCHYFVHEPVRSRAAWLVEKYAALLPKGASHDRAVYAAMVETLDHLVGELLHALDDFGLAENTLVVFISDNGGNPKYSANAPLRGSKWNVYEGGLRVPAIVRWPGKTPAGTVTDALMIGTDLFPTFCAVGGALPAREVVLDGRNVLPLWQRVEPPDMERALVWHFPYYHPEENFEAALPRIGINDFAISQSRPQSAIRLGDWVLVHFYESDRDELYRLSDDLSQQHDLASREPAKAAELRRRMDEYLQSSGARFPVRKTSAPATTSRP